MNSKLSDCPPGPPAAKGSESRTGPLPAALKSQLDRAYDKFPLKNIIAATGLAEGTLWRAKAGGGVYYGTMIAIRCGLSALEQADVDAAAGPSSGGQR